MREVVALEGEAALHMLHCRIHTPTPQSELPCSSKLEIA
jgi:hypothetical protein